MKTAKRRLRYRSNFIRCGWKWSPQNTLVCITDPDGLAAEKFRFLGVRLRHLQQSRSLKRLLITSSMAEEGKSTVAANLACTLARKGQRVLLLEGDLRRPALAERFGMRRAWAD